ncbi:MAG: hypothetical protein AAGH90_03770 [Pseudomonadota bacterium]
MIKAISVSVPKHGFVALTFSDGTTGVYDMTLILARSGAMIDPLKDTDFFTRVFLELGAPTWPNGFDLAPWDIHKKLSESGGLRQVTSAA